MPADQLAAIGNAESGKLDVEAEVLDEGYSVIAPEVLGLTVQDAIRMRPEGLHDIRMGA